MKGGKSLWRGKFVIYGFVTGTGSEECLQISITYEWQEKACHAGMEHDMQH
jgi:hypothetical protein